MYQSSSIVEFMLSPSCREPYLTNTFFTVLSGLALYNDVAKLIGGDARYYPTEGPSSDVSRHSPLGGRGALTN